MKKHCFPIILVLVAMVVAGCTFNISPTAPLLPPANGVALDSITNVILLRPTDFVDHEEVSSFESRQLRLSPGIASMQAIEAVLRRSFRNIEIRDVKGDGMIEYMQHLPTNDSSGTILARPRFIRVASSVRPFHLDIEVALALDVVGLSRPTSVRGEGIGSASLYTDSAIRRAIDTALYKAVIDLDSKLTAEMKLVSKL